MSRFDVVTLGELLVDCISCGTSERDNPLFEGNPGGAVANVAAMLRKLGYSVSFIGKVGDDFFGHMLSEKVQQCGIDTSGLFFDKEIHTTLALVHTASDGDRSFSFYRNPGADMRLTASEVLQKRALIEGAGLFHFGSLSLTDSPVREATICALDIARQSGLPVSYDPNYRPPLWRSEEDARQWMSYGLSRADFVKISDNEILFLSGCDDLDRGARTLIERYRIPFLCATYGKKGSRAYIDGKSYFCPPLLTSRTVETTGAGDTFCACMLDYVLKYGVTLENEEILQKSLRFASSASSLVTCRKGALMVMPEPSEILQNIGDA